MSGFRETEEGLIPKWRIKVLDTIAFFLMPEVSEYEIPIFAPPITAKC